MARESSFKNMVMALSVICLVCATLLGGVYSLTKSTIAKSEFAKVEANVKVVLPQYDNSPIEEAFTIGDAKIYPATLSGESVGCAILLSVEGFGGPLTLLTGFTADGTVYNTAVLSHFETPGLGAKITDSTIPTRTQVIGKNPTVTKVSVVKDGGSIDAITASTITSRAYLNGINKASEIFIEIDESRK